MSVYIGRNTRNRVIQVEPVAFQYHRQTPWQFRTLVKYQMEVVLDVSGEFSRSKSTAVTTLSWKRPPLKLLFSNLVTMNCLIPLKMLRKLLAKLLWWGKNAPFIWKSASQRRWSISQYGITSNDLYNGDLRLNLINDALLIEKKRRERIFNFAQCSKVWTIHAKMWKL